MKKKEIAAIAIALAIIASVTLLYISDHLTNSFGCPNKYDYGVFTITTSYYPYNVTKDEIWSVLNETSQVTDVEAREYGFLFNYTCLNLSGELNSRFHNSISFNNRILNFRITYQSNFSYSKRVCDSESREEWHRATDDYYEMDREIMDAYFSDYARFMVYGCNMINGHMGGNYIPEKASEYFEVPEQD